MFNFKLNSEQKASWEGKKEKKTCHNQINLCNGFYKLTQIAL